MSVYRDMTFCASACANEQCHRKLTEADREAGRKWWGSDDFPVSYADFAAHGCPDHIEPQPQRGVG